MFASNFLSLKSLTTALALLTPFIPSTHQQQTPVEIPFSNPVMVAPGPKCLAVASDTNTPDIKVYNPWSGNITGIIQDALDNSDTFPRAVFPDGTCNKFVVVHQPFYANAPRLAQYTQQPNGKYQKNTDVSINHASCLAGNLYANKESINGPVPTVYVTDDMNNTRQVALLSGVTVNKFSLPATDLRYDKNGFPDFIMYSQPGDLTQFLKLATNEIYPVIYSANFISPFAVWNKADNSVGFIEQDQPADGPTEVTFYDVITDKPVSSFNLTSPSTATFVDPYNLWYARNDGTIHAINTKTAQETTISNVTQTPATQLLVFNPENNDAPYVVAVSADGLTVFPIS